MINTVTGSIDNWITKDPSSYQKTTVTNTNEFAISFNTDNNGTHFLPKGLQNSNTRNTSPFLLNQLKNKAYRISKIQFNDINSIFYNWTEEDFFQIEGYNAITYVYDIDEKITKFRYDLDGESVIQGGYSQFIPATFKFQTMEQFKFVIDEYFHECFGNNQQEILFDKIYGRWTFSSQTDYQIRISRPLQVFLFSQQKKFEQPYYNIFSVKRNLMLYPNIDRTCVIHLNDENFITINDFSKNIIELNQMLIGNDPINNILNSNTPVKFFYLSPSNQFVDQTNYDSQLLSNIILDNNNEAYGRSRGYYYYDVNEAYQPSFSVKSMIVYFQEYDTIYV